MDYNYNGYDRGYTEPAMTSADYMNRTYRWMAVGLLITFAAAFVTAATPLLMKLLTGLNEEGKTVVMVSHDDDALSYCKEIVQI